MRSAAKYRSAPPLHDMRGAGLWRLRAAVQIKPYVRLCRKAVAVRVPRTPNEFTLTLRLTPSASVPIRWSRPKTF